MSITLIDVKETKYLKFEKNRLFDKKTFNIKVMNKDAFNPIKLGIISWYSGWRRYCFHPEPTTLFDSKCLDGIKKYIDELMEERK